MRTRQDGALPSEANFLYLQTFAKSRDVAERLLKSGIVVRDCGTFPGCGKHGLRVTVGRPEENDRFLKEFERANLIF
jgi:histidinol-phosphate aminotransferase